LETKEIKPHLLQKMGFRFFSGMVTLWIMD
jgi:hypothetical protein